MTPVAASDLDRARYLRDLLTHRQPLFDRLPHQVPPDGDWFFWLLEAGRGAGKTAAAAHYVQAHLNGPPCISKELPHRVLLVAPTIGDGIESATLNDQALTRIEPGARFSSGAGGSRVIWPNGSQVKVLGVHSREDIERLRAQGGNICAIWCEELAAWRHLEEAWEIMLPGLRVGPHPRIVATTTPKARPEYKTVRAQADVISHATTLDNPNLNEKMRERLYDLYGDTSIGRQELYGELIEEAEGALWTSDMIDTDRLHHVEGLGRVVVAIDPPGGATEAGIVAAGLLPECGCGGGRLPHFAVLADVSGKVSPDVWASRAVDLLRELGGDRIIGEKNYGGDMVESVIRNYAPDVSYKNVTASRGKRLRAEPIQALFEQHRVHMVGQFPELEDQMVQWIPDESKWSPDRLDACLAGDTLIATPHGAVPIRDVVAGMEVWTRYGWRVVEAQRLTRRGAETITVVLSNGDRLTGTSDHRILVGDTWQRLDALRCGDTLAAWKQSHIEGSYTNGILRGRTGRVVSTTTRHAAPGTAHSTERFTNRRSVSSLQGSLSTTSTTTLATTTRRTFKPSHRKSIPVSIPAATSGRLGSWRTWLRSGLSPSRGTAQPKGVRGTSSTPSTFGNGQSRRLSSVRSAAKRQRRGAEVSGTAPADVPAVSLTVPTGTVSEWRARSAATSFGSRSTGLSLSPVPVSVVASYVGVVADVYDLQVADVHEFVAAGVVVHNCVWAIHELTASRILTGDLMV